MKDKLGFIVRLIVCFSLGAAAWSYAACDQVSSEIDKTAYLEVRERLLDKDFLSDPARAARRNAVKGVRADYDSEPRLADDPRLIAHFTAATQVDIKHLVGHCEELGLNCYHFSIWHRETDWEDFIAFVEEAEKSSTLKERNFTVWAYIVPPSESQKRRSEPFGMDYVAWMENVAKFSSDHPMVTAVCIDDFNVAPENRSLFTRDYVQKMRQAADKFNSHLALVPVLYWNDVSPQKMIRALTEASVIGDIIDGILYPYMAQSKSKGLSHADTSALAGEIRQVREIYPGVPVILDIYVSRHLACPDFPDAKWVGEMIDLSKVNNDGVALYCMPKKNKDGSFSRLWSDRMRDPAAIFEAVKSRFSGWK